MEVEELVIGWIERLIDVVNEAFFRGCSLGSMDPCLYSSR